MWKQVGLVLTVAAIGLGSGEAEARFGKRSTPPPSSSPGGGGPSRPGGGGDHWGGRPHHGYYPRGYYGYYGYPWGSYYYFDPAWAWPFLGVGVPSYGRYYGYDLTWRRLRPPPPPPSVQDVTTPPAALDLRVDTGFVREGYSVGLGLQVDGQRFGFGTRLDLFNLAPEDGGMGRDAISLFSLGPSVLLVNNERVKWRLTGGLDAAFAPDITMIGPGVGTSARLKVAGPLKLEASAHWTPLPYVQLSGDAGVGVDLGSLLKLRAGYRATYLSDQGLVDGIVNRDLFAGPFVGLSLAP